MNSDSTHSKNLPQENTTEKSPIALREERILQFWNEHDIFQKSLQKKSPQGEYVFYDGPPFATGTPHTGHILAGSIKDVLPRFKTMQGYHVPRRWGWDCHGLPLENIIEKELGISTKRQIEELGVGKFNAAARSAVLRYAHIWEQVIPRVGRWVDMKNSYRTMDTSYTKSVWWVFRSLYDKGLIYEGYKSMQLCPRCGTTLSNFEVNQGYKDISDISVYAKFAVVGRESTYFIAWTTTPWTLPGNAALAINTTLAYIEVDHEGSTYILAKDSLSKVFKDTQNLKMRDVSAGELIGLSYTPPFNYFAEKYKNSKTIWKVYHADFVTLEKGTGIVHIAPAFGAEDMELGEKEGIPMIQHVGTDGIFVPEVIDFVGQTAKPKPAKNAEGVAEKDGHQKTDIEIIKYLAGKGLLFAKEKIVHSYPHCWRCNTPLLNYASSSWFVRVTDIKDSLVKENSKIKWVPQAVGENRFGNWLSGARDWAISRTRYWGAPLPVWKNKQGDVLVASTLDEIRTYGKERGQLVIMRHGETVYNVEGRVSSDITDTQDHVTEKGHKQIEESAQRLKKIYGDFDVIIASPFLRTQETAKIVSDTLGHSQKIITDDRLVEVQTTKYNGASWDAIHALYANRDEYFTKKVEGLESLVDVRIRVGKAIDDILTQYAGKKILVISHGTPLRIMEALSCGDDVDTNHSFFTNAEFREVSTVKLPHNEAYEIDLHRPYIDDVVLVHPKTKRELNRIVDVFDCWFESGSMPYGEAGYVGSPTCGTAVSDKTFDPKGGFFTPQKGFPADFIAEGLDQTRGWFYSMLVLGVALFGKSPYKSVIVNGLALAEDGRKMSKSLKNYTDPMDLVNKYGADSLRYYMLTSGIVQGEDIAFSDRGVDEVSKKIINRLDNTMAFYEMYAKEKHGMQAHTNNVLDAWAVARVHETIVAVTEALEKHEINTALRPIGDLIEDISVWYVRRSRDRFKADTSADKTQTLETSRYVFVEMAKMMAPFMPFFAEDVYARTVQGLTTESAGVDGTNNIAKSVHLEDWSKISKVTTAEQTVLKHMAHVRKLVTAGLELRMKANIKVRQPLVSATVTTQDLSDAYLDVLKDELNVKEILVVEKLETDTALISLDTSLTPELKEEGIMRELIRAIQDARKDAGLTAGATANLTIGATNAIKDLLHKHRSMIQKTAQIADITFVDGELAGKAVVIEGATLILRVE